MAASLGQAFIDVKASTRGFAKDLSGQLKAVLAQAQKDADVAFGKIGQSARAASSATIKVAQASGRAQAQSARDAARAAIQADGKRVARLAAFGKQVVAAQRAADKERVASATTAAKAIAEADKARAARLAAFGRAAVAAQKAADKARVASSAASAKQAIADAKLIEKAIVDAARASAAAARVADAERAASAKRASALIAEAAKAAAAQQVQAARLAAAAQREAAAAAATVKSGLAGIGGAASTAFGKLATAAKFATLGVLALGAALTGVGIQQAGQIQLAQTAFSSLSTEIENGETVVKEYDKAAREAIGNKFVEELQNLAIHSSLAFGTLTSTTQSLLSLGFAGGEAQAIVLTVGDALAASGKAGGQLNEDLRGVIVAFSQIKGAGRLLAQDLNQITTRIPSATRLKVYNNLAKDLGLVSKSAKSASPEMIKARKEVIKLAEAGGINADDALKSIITTLRDVPGASGALDRVNKTLPGQIEQIKETIRLRLGQALLPITEELANRLGDLGDRLNEKLVEIGPKLRDFALSFATTLQEVIPAVLDATGQAFDFLGRAIDVIGPSLPGLIRGFGDLFTTAGAAFDKLVPLIPIFAGIGQAIGAAIDIFGLFAGALGVVADLLGNLPVGVLEGLGNVIGAVAVGIGALILATKLFTAAQVVLNLVLALNPIGLVVLAVAALATGFVIAWKKSETFRKIVVGVLGAIAEAASRAIDFVLGLLQALVDAFGAVASKIPFVGDAIGGAFDEASDAIQKTRDKINDVATAIQNLPTEKKVVVTLQVITEIGKANTEFLNKKGIPLTGLEDASGFSEQGIKEATKDIKTVAENAADKQKKEIEDLLKRLEESGKSQRDTTKAAGNKAADSAAQAAKNRAQQFRNAIRAILDSIDSEFKKTLVTGTSKQIDSALDGLRKKIASAFLSAKKQPPSKLLKAVEEDNRALKRLADRRDSILKKLAAATSRANEVASSVLNFANAISETTAKIRQQVADLSRLRIILPGQDALFGDGKTKAQRTSQDFANTLKDRLKAIKEFQANIQKLIKAGLNKETIDQIVSAGVDEGGLLARSLTSAGKQTIKSINDSQKAIETAAEKLGNTAADSLFRSGKKVADGLIAGLIEKRDEIKDAMKTIADDLVSEIKKQLKIKSPSRVMAEVGGFAGSGLALGLEAAAPAVRRASEILAGASVPSFQQISLPQLQARAATESRISPVPGLVGGAAANARATSVVNHNREVNAPINQTFNVSAGVDERALADGIGRSIAGRLR